MKLIIEDDEGRKTVVQLVRDEITIGRQDGNTIRLTERNVSRRHARLVKENGNVLIEDLGSYNGVRVNGEKITGRTRVKEGDLVEIGDYDLGIQGKLDAPVMTPAAGTTRPPTIPPGGLKPPRPPTLPPQAMPGALGAAQAAFASEKTAPAVQAPIPPPAVTPNPTAGGATAIIRVSDVSKAGPQVEARDLERSEMPRLVGLAGPFRGKEFYLMRTEVKFGRTDENDIVADHQSVSRAHARFVLDEGQWKVIDNKSANGVRVNGDEYAISSLKPGDVVELGHLKFRFCGPGEKFSPPPEKGEDGAQKGVTTAELIAGAQGRQASTPAGRKSGAARIVLISVGVGAVVGAAAFFATRPRKPARPEQATGEDAVKAGDALFKQHKSLAAVEMYEKAGTSPAPNRKKTVEEAQGEEAYNSLRAAITADDGDKARTLFDRCAADSTYWCRQAQEQGDQVRSAYAKTHLAQANAFKSAGKIDG